MLVMHHRCLLLMSAVYYSLLFHLPYSNSGEGYCNDPYKGCHHVTDLNEMTDVSVLIKIKTGIRGASQIMITQPVTYCE